MFPYHITLLLVPYPNIENSPTVGDKKKNVSNDGCYTKWHVETAG